MNYKEKDYKAFEMFAKEWALVTAGTMEDFNGCTIGWGGIGTLWRSPVVTVYLHPARLTCKYLKEHDTFTVSFYPESCKKALGIMGTRSGRDGDKVAEAGLTPVAIGDSVTFAEARQTFLCRKLYQHQLAKEALAEDIQHIYSENPNMFPPDENGEWEAHWVFVGEIIDVEES